MATIFPGSSVPSGFVLWAMKELPSSVVKQEVRTLAFIDDKSREIYPPPQSWIAATSLQNQVEMHLFTFMMHVHASLVINILNYST